MPQAQPEKLAYWQGKLNVRATPSHKFISQISEVNLFTCVRLGNLTGTIWIAPYPKNGPPPKEPVAWEMSTLGHKSLHSCHRYHDAQWHVVGRLGTAFFIDTNSGMASVFDTLDFEANEFAFRFSLFDVFSVLGIRSDSSTFHLLCWLKGMVESCESEVFQAKYGDDRCKMVVLRSMAEIKSRDVSQKSERTERTARPKHWKIRNIWTLATVQAALDWCWLNCDLFSTS